MYANDLIEVICAAHLTAYVDSDFLDRGGLMLVGPPGSLRTTFLSVLDQQYNDAVAVSDINAKSLAVLRDAIATELIRTLVLPEFGKIYERAAATATNVEGVLRALVAEGFQAASFDDQRVNRLKARAMVIGALTTTLQSERFTLWENTGFNRRFLWSLIRLQSPGVLEQAAVDDKLLRWKVSRPPWLKDQVKIPRSLTMEERHRIRLWVKYQPGGSHTLQVQLLGKIATVLRWWYREIGSPCDAMETVERFAVSLGRDGATVDLGSHDSLPTRQHRKKGRRK